MLWSAKIKEYISHLEVNDNTLGQKKSPGIINLAGRSFSVAIQSMLPDRPLKRNETKQQRRRKNNDLLKNVRAMTKSSANAAAIAGPGDGLKAQKVAEMDPPLTFNQALASVPLWQKKMANLQRKIDRLAPDTKPENASFMRYLLGRQRAAYLGFTFICQTSNRIGTVHRLTVEKNLVFIREGGEEVAIFVPVGASSTKVEGKRKGRMPRQFFVAWKAGGSKRRAE